MGTDRKDHDIMSPLKTVKLHKVNVWTTLSSDACVSVAELLEENEDGYHLETIAEVSQSSRRHPDDRFDEEVGQMLALGRALEVLGKKLQRKAHNRVKMLEHNSAHSRRAKKKEPSKRFWNNKTKVA